VIPVAYLCLGYPVEFQSQPLLQTEGWRDRLPLTDLLRYDDWEGVATPPEWSEFQRALEAN
jgi:5,6-dimethylbenzimidazole synthase